MVVGVREPYAFAKTQRSVYAQKHKITLCKLKIRTFKNKFYANQNYKDISPHTSQNGHHHQKNLQTINAGEGVEKREPSCTAGGNVN